MTMVAYPEMKSLPKNLVEPINWVSRIGSDFERRKLTDSNGEFLTEKCRKMTIFGASSFEATSKFFGRGFKFGEKVGIHWEVKKGHQKESILDVKKAPKNDVHFGHQKRSQKCRQKVIKNDHGRLPRNETSYAKFVGGDKSGVQNWRRFRTPKIDGF